MKTPTGKEASSYVISTMTAQGYENVEAMETDFGSDEGTMMVRVQFTNEDGEYREGEWVVWFNCNDRIYGEW